MKIKPLTRVILVGAVAWTLFLLVVALLAVTRSADLTLADAAADGGPDRPGSPSAVGRVLLPQSTAAYNAVAVPAKTVYAPWLLAGTSVLRILNADESRPTTVKATFFNRTGQETVAKVLGPGAVGDIRSSAFPTGTQLAAILTATQSIAAVVNDFGPAGAQASSYAAMPASLGQAYLALPDILSQAGDGWNSQVVVQNVGQADTQITVVYTQTKSFTTTTWSQTSPPVGVGETHVFQPSEAGMPAGSWGIASLRASQPLVTIVRNAAAEIGTPVPRRVYIYCVPVPTAGSESDQPLFYPFLVNAFQDWKKSEIQFMNTASSVAGFELEIFGEPPSSITVEPWWAVSVRQDVAGKPTEWTSAGRVQDVRSIHSLVWLEGDFDGDSFAAYSAPRVGARTLFLPYADQGESLATFIAVQNLNQATVGITLTLHTVTGTAGSRRFTIERLGNMALYTGGDGLPSAFSGGVRVEADQPVAAVAVIAGRLVLDQEMYLPVVTRED